MIMKHYASDREMRRAERAFFDGATVYMRKSSKNGCPLVYAAGLVYEEVILAKLSAPKAQYIFCRRATRKERKQHEPRAEGRRQPIRRGDMSVDRVQARGDDLRVLSVPPGPRLGE